MLIELSNRQNLGLPLVCDDPGGVREELVIFAFGDTPGVDNNLLLETGVELELE